MERGSTEFLCSVSLLGSVFISSVGGGGTGCMYVIIGRGSSVQIESSSDGIRCGD